MPEPQLKNTEKIHIVKLKVSNEKGKAKVKVNLREQAMQISWLVKSFPEKNDSLMQGFNLSKLI